ncbi:hypothetical protein AVEN_178055-1 [Araneus ventricosus]|uniref:Uncharacterized protein n=1 Tax=Araneus ventricosus TaxID=182803 RepID=A0A4Y2I588_ARAVE|nr:hypothetical protein AVEN_178055-1 [Araneus ventricosus]
MGRKADNEKSSKCKKPVISPNTVQTEAVNSGTVQENKGNSTSDENKVSDGSTFKNVAGTNDNLASKSDDPPLKASNRPTLLQKLRPSYKPPSWKALFENLLNEVTTLLQNDMVSAFENKECTLMEDGWSYSVKQRMDDSVNASELAKKITKANAVDWSKSAWSDLDSDLVALQVVI